VARSATVIYQRLSASTLALAISIFGAAVSDGDARIRAVGRYTRLTIYRTAADAAASKVCSGTASVLAAWDAAAQSNTD
jgi:hypothetical protein